MCLCVCARCTAKVLDGSASNLVGLFRETPDTTSSMRYFNTCSQRAALNRFWFHLSYPGPHTDTPKPLDRHHQRQSSRWIFFKFGHRIQLHPGHNIIDEIFQHVLSARSAEPILVFLFISPFPVTLPYLLQCFQRLSPFLRVAVVSIFGYSRYYVTIFRRSRSVQNVNCTRKLSLL